MIDFLPNFPSFVSVISVGMGLHRFRIIWCFARVAQWERVRASLGFENTQRLTPLPFSKQSVRGVMSWAFSPLRPVANAEFRLK